MNNASNITLFYCLTTNKSYGLYWISVIKLGIDSKKRGMIIMRKDIPTIILSLILVLLFSQVALGSQAEWQINWQEDGTLLEKVTVSGLPIQNSDPGWQKSMNGDQIIFTRTIKNWNEYNRLQDKLPLKVAESNYIFCTASKLTASNQLPGGTLYAGLSGIDRMNLKISVPGMITSSSVEPSDKRTVIWAVNNPGQQFNKDFSLKAISVDGFMLGITILTLGVIGLFIFFLGRMRRVNRLIDETYSLDNIVIEDDEIELDDSGENTKIE